MKDDNTKKTSNREIIKKVLASLGIGCGIFLLLVISSLIIDFDDNWNMVIMNIFSFILMFTLIMLIWNKKYKKIIKFIIIFILIILIINTIYYKNYSMKIEPLIYLHNKYNFNYSDMKIIESTDYYSGDIFGEGRIYRSSTIKYDEYNIYVNYKNGWNDDYKDQVRYNERYKKILNNFNSIIAAYSSDFKIIQDMQLNEQVDDDTGLTDYGYIIYLYSTDENAIDNIIKQLDSFVTNYNSSDISYGLYIVKNKQIYNELINADISALNSDNTGVFGQTYGADLLKTVGYNVKRITFYHGFDKTIFINNGDETYPEYQDPEKFEYIVFWYSFGKNSSNNNLQIFGIKH